MFALRLMCLGILCVSSQLKISLEKEKVSLAAFRGASGLLPENTPAVMAETIEPGVDFAGLDVRALADGCTGLFHNITMECTSDLSGNLWERNIADIKYRRRLMVCPGICRRPCADICGFFNQLN